MLQAFGVSSVNGSEEALNALLESPGRQSTSDEGFPEGVQNPDDKASIE